MSEITQQPFEFNCNSTPLQIYESLQIYNFAKLNGFLKAKSYLLEQLRDAIEMADFFQLNYKANSKAPSNKDLAIKRFSNLDTSREIPYLRLEDLPFGNIVVQKLLQQKPFPGLFELHRPKTDIHIHSSILRPAQSANSQRSTDWKWHQDVKFHKSLYDLSIWIPLVSCGKYAPGLQFVIAPNLKKIQEVDIDSGWYLNSELQSNLDRINNRYAPEFSEGDCIIFNTFAIHKTYALPDMKKERTSIDVRLHFR